MHAVSRNGRLAREFVASALLVAACHTSPARPTDTLRITGVTLPTAGSGLPAFRVRIDPRTPDVTVTLHGVAPTPGQAVRVCATDCASPPEGRGVRLRALQGELSIDQTGAATGSEGEIARVEIAFAAADHLVVARLPFIGPRATSPAFAFLPVTRGHYAAKATWTGDATGELTAGTGKTDGPSGVEIHGDGAAGAVTLRNTADTPLRAPVLTMNFPENGSP